jgi:cell division protein FtsI/penicillin-binding protein 2
MKSLLLLLFASLIALPPSGGVRDRSPDRDALPANSLFAQSADQILTRDFPSGNISYLLVDAAGGTILTSRWEHPETPIPLGSLVKPFTALAYGEHHAFRYPPHVCRGTATGCWRPGGHGAVNLSSAIAYSCNSYFRVLTQAMTAADISPIATRFSIEPPSAETAGSALAGFGNQWLISPQNMANAYLELARRRDQPGVSDILAGMAESAREGTGAEVDRALALSAALVKTGTAPCTHSAHASGDGFAIAMTPADNPKILLMVRLHGSPGSQAAKIAGQMLSRIQP